MRQKYRTTFFADAVEPYEASLEGSATLREPVTGFRVVYDNQHNISRGGMWSYDQECSRGAYHFNNGWTNSHPALGFRLVWERR